MKTKVKYISSISKFRLFINELEKNKEAYFYKLYIQTSQSDMFLIVSEYKKINTKFEKLRGNVLQLIINIEIQKRADYKLKFGDIFCEPFNLNTNKKVIRNEYKDISFEFIIDFNLNRTNFEDLASDYYKLGIEEYYPNLWQNVSSYFKFNIYEEEDYCIFKKIADTHKENILFHKTEFIFNIYLCSTKHIALLNYYTNIVSQYICCAGKISNKVNFLEPANKYTCTYVNYFDFMNDRVHDNSIKCNEMYNETILRFDVELLDVSSSLPLLHDYIMLCNKFKHSYRGIILNITSKSTQSIDDKHRVKAYISVTINNNFYVIFNNELLINDISSIGKLPPAIYVTKDNPKELAFLKRPLSREIWTKIIQRSLDNDETIIPINSTTFRDDVKNTDEYTTAKKYWPLLRMCQKYLFDSFSSNESIVYTQLRSQLYSSSEFYDRYVSKMPFLSVCVFALYDQFFRDDLLQKYKEKTGIRELYVEDFLLSKQQKQRWDRYEQYEKVKDLLDIKNLLLDVNTDSLVIHKTVESEIFEAIMITEAILQILENAVFHAGGGLLSMRIYSQALGLKNRSPRHPIHVKYLKETYGLDYLNYLKTNFFLEVYISDLSNMSIPEKFIENHCDEKVVISDEREAIRDLLISNKSKINLNYFFNPTDDQTKIKSNFYKMSVDNVVHHYGLDIFNSILTSRNGIFSVVGYGDSYDNLDDVFNGIYKPLYLSISNSEELSMSIFNFLDYDLNQLNDEKKKRVNKIRNNLQKNKELQGTCYRVLLPLNHLPTSSFSYPQNEIIFSEDIGLMNLGEDIPIIIDKNTILNHKYLRLHNPLDDQYTIKHKEENINIIADIISIYYDDLFPLSNKCLCLNLYEGDCEMDVDIYFEEIVKGLLLFALRESTKKYNTAKQLPIAIVNLSAFHLIEGARIIATYYAKNDLSEQFNVFKKIPIYLKSIEIGKELVFEGNNVLEITEKLIKTAMTNGTMYNELTTIIDIFNKMQSNKQGDFKHE